MMQISQTQQNSGFTLMEVLVASVLISIVMTSVYTLFHSTIVSWRTVERGDDIHREGRAFISLFQREVNNLVTEADHLFEGEDDEVTMFVVSEPLDTEDSTGRHMMRVRYRYNRGENEIVREEALVESPLPRAPNVEGRAVDRGRIKTAREEEFVVAEHVTDFNLSYVWIPLPKEGRPVGTPPWPVEPIVAEEHRELWRLGYPNAVRLDFTLAAPEEEEKEFQVSAVAPIRVPGKAQTAEQLADRMGGGR